MIYTELTKKALKIAFNAHKDQVDKGGLPYIFHPLHVAYQQENEYCIIVALLHDVVEDTNLTFKELENEFPIEVIDALKLLTHDKNEDYFEYVKKVKNNNIAKSVKLADLKHNSDLSRLSNCSEKDLERINKYRHAIDILEDKF